MEVRSLARILAVPIIGGSNEGRWYRKETQLLLSYLFYD